MLTACGSSGSSSTPAAATACTVNNGTVYPYGTTTPNANCPGVPPGYTNINGQLVYTGTTGTSVYGNSNPCAMAYGPTWTVQNTAQGPVCVSYSGY